jgi:hypothetical protein
LELFCDLESEACLESLAERDICCIMRRTIDWASEACCEAAWESDALAEEDAETFFETLTEIDPLGEVVVVDPESWLEVVLPLEDEL